MDSKCFDMFRKKRLLFVHIFIFFSINLTVLKLCEAAIIFEKYQKHFDLDGPIQLWSSRQKSQIDPVTMNSNKSPIVFVADQHRTKRDTSWTLGKIYSNSQTHNSNPLTKTWSQRSSVSNHPNYASSPYSQGQNRKSSDAYDDESSEILNQQSDTNTHSYGQPQRSQYQGSFQSPRKTSSGQSKQSESETQQTLSHLTSIREPLVYYNGPNNQTSELGWSRSKMSQYPSWDLLGHLMSRSRDMAQGGSRDKSLAQDGTNPIDSDSVEQLVTLFRGVGFAELDGDDNSTDPDTIDTFVDPSQLRPVGWIVME